MRTRSSRLLVAVLALTAAIGFSGCGDPGPEAGSGAEPFQKLGDADKLQKIKAMPISNQMKVDAIKKLNLPEADKQKAIAEVSSAPATAPGGPPSSPGSQR